MPWLKAGKHNGFRNTYSYVYDENGTRFSKTVNGTTTQFNYVGGLLLSQKTGEEIIFFQYGAGGVPLGFVYNGTQYFYVTNQLGDVLGITDDTGDAFVMYSYDEWGNPIQTVTRDNTEEQNKIAQLNPLRYRGYYYDAETGYYYLQSRYYNPEWGRFISADSLIILTIPPASVSMPIFTAPTILLCLLILQVINMFLR